MSSTPDYTILAPPRIPPDYFAHVLLAAGSPAAHEAGACYRAFVAAGVDPAVGLAIFRKESTYGLFGRAHVNRSWGNIRGGTAYPLDDKAFRIYPTWAAGAADAARLLRIYGLNQIRPGTRTDTVQRLPYVWAPAADGNAPDAYGDSLALWIRAWISASSRPWWPAWLSAPPATATFAIVFAPGTYWRLHPDGSHLERYRTAGFSAYGHNVASRLGRLTGQLSTGSRTGWWIVLSQGRLYRRPGAF